MTRPKRLHRRIPVHQRCWCESGSITIYAQLANLSEGGLFVKTFAPLAEGARARVRWALGEEELEAEAVVVWRRDGQAATGGPPGMGLKFEALDPAAQACIRSFVDRILAEPSEG
ncbi:MAG: TIGR02266 family protein [Deltaproteobacteria bacterium]|nr:MAG: TIGR02266 family protein [Deltaproteobacteria bacterium]